jgi:hypothetical protein
LAVAKQHAKGAEPYVWVWRNQYMQARQKTAELLVEHGIDGDGDAEEDDQDEARQPRPIRTVCGMMKVSAVAHHSFMLQLMNANVSTLQKLCAVRTEELNELESQNMILAPNQKSRQVLQYLASATEAFSTDHRIKRERSQSNDSSHGPEVCEEGITMSQLSRIKHRRDSIDSVDEENLYPAVTPAQSYDDCDDGDMSEQKPSLTEAFFASSYEKLEETRRDLAAESAAAAVVAKKHALKKIFDAKRAIELFAGRAFFSMSSTAFVTFNSRVSAGIAHQMLLSHDNHQMEVTPAPAISDIIWQNLYVKKSQIDKRTTFASAAFIAGVIFWSVVVTGIRSVFSLKALDANRSNNTFLGLHEGTAMYALFNDYLAVGILLSLLAFLPLIFDLVARKYERLRTESRIQQSIMWRYFAYMLANVYINVTADSILTSLKTIFSNPGSVLKVLGESLPNVSALFACMIILYTFVGLMVEFIRAWPILTFYTLTMFQDKRRCTRRQLRTGAFAAARMLYGWIYPCLLMIFMIIMIYSCIAPMVSLLAVMYFGFAYIMYKYQLLYVYVNEYQSGGQMWYSIFNMSLISLLCGVVTLMGFLASKKELISGPFYFIIPLPLFIVVFWRYCNNKFYSPSVVRPLFDL